MFERRKEALVQYYLVHMMTKDQVLELATSLGYSGVRSGTKSALLDRLRSDRGVELSLTQIREYALARWSRPPVDFHLATLRSGKLKGHDWHGAAPQRLHLALQNQVRQMLEGGSSIDAFLSLGSDIVKHEYFIVAVADLCEDLIVTEFGAIPPTIAKSVSDFVLDDVPYDLKCTRMPAGMSRREIEAEPETFVRTMVGEADVARERAQATDSVNDWANNRFYVVTEDELAWELNPEALLANLTERSKRLGRPHRIRTEVGWGLFQVVVISAAI